MRRVKQFRSGRDDGGLWDYGGNADVCRLASGIPDGGRIPSGSLFCLALRHARGGKGNASSCGKTFPGAEDEGAERTGYGKAVCLSFGGSVYAGSVERRRYGLGSGLYTRNIRRQCGACDCGNDYHSAV